MRKLPKFTEKEIEYLKNCVFKSDTELTDSGIFVSCKSFTPFKNDLVNKLTKYFNVLKEQEYNVT